MKAETLGRLVSEHAKAIITVVLTLTLIFGYFTTNIQMTTDYKSFMPDDDISKAYNEIGEDYYSTEMVQILIRYDGANALSKEALIEELELEKNLSQDLVVSENLQTPSEPSKSIYSVAEMVIGLDVMGNMAISMMNSTINMVPALEQMNSSLDRVQGSLSMYLFYYSQDPTSNETIQSLYTSYYVLNAFLEAGDGIEMPSPPSEPPAMSIDQKIAYLNNMSDEELHNILVYGIPISPEDMQELGMKFMKASQEVKILSTYISEKSGAVASSIEECMGTEPVQENQTINETFVASYPVFLKMRQEFSELSDIMDNIGEINPSVLNMMAGMMKGMISTDFDASTASADATLMIVNLNGTADTYGNENGDTKMLKVHERIRQITGSFDGEGDYSVMSIRLMNEDMNSSMDQTFNVLLPVAFLLVIIILLFVFRSLVDTVLGLLGLFIAIIWTYGIGVIMGLEFNMITTTVSILIVGLGIDYAIHTIMRYREELEDGNDVKASVVKMETHLGMALILATLTTTISFLSNLISPIPPLRDYGIMNAIGILSAFILFITFIPAIKVILDTRKEKQGKPVIKRKKKSSVGVEPLNRTLSLGAIAAEQHPWKVIAVVLILSVASLYGAMNLGTDFSESDFLPQNTQSYEILNYITGNFNASGMEESYVLIKGNITSPELLLAMEETLHKMEDDKYLSVANSQNLVYLIKSRENSDSNFSELVKTLDTNGDGLPDSHLQKVYDYLYVHDEKTKYILHRTREGMYDSTLIRVKPTSESNSQHAVLYNQLLDDIKPLKEEGFYAQVTGGSIMTYTITNSLQKSQWNSLILTLILTLLILVIVFGYQRKSVMLGIITTLPVLIALLWSMGIMYLIGMNFDMMTVTITSLTIGLGITYAIHLSHRFVEELDERSPEEAARITVVNTGSAIFGAAATTMGGFGVLMLSSMPPMQDFGIIATMSILLSFLLSVFVLPTFLVMWARKKNGKNGSE